MVGECRVRQPGSRLHSDFAVQQFRLLCVFLSAWLQTTIVLLYFQRRGQDLVLSKGRQAALEECIPGFLLFDFWAFFFLGGGIMMSIL